MKIEHREWRIDSAPQRHGHLWHAWVQVERGPWENEDIGQIFHFTDIGYYDTITTPRPRPKSAVSSGRKPGWIRITDARPRHAHA